eukprot:33547_2
MTMTMTMTRCGTGATDRDPLGLPAARIDGADRADLLEAVDGVGQDIVGCRIRRGHAAVADGGFQSAHPACHQPVQPPGRQEQQPVHELPYPEAEEQGLVHSQQRDV